MYGQKLALLHGYVTTVELVGTEMARCTRAAVARGILPSPDPDPGRCQASRHKPKSVLCPGEVRILIFDDPAELEAWQCTKYRFSQLNCILNSTMIIPLRSAGY
jgi:hypothetical protein